MVWIAFHTRTGFGEGPYDIMHQAGQVSFGMIHVCAQRAAKCIFYVFHYQCIWSNIEVVRLEVRLMHMIPCAWQDNKLQGITSISIFEIKDLTLRYDAVGPAVRIS